MGHRYYLYGPPGAGKSTVGRLLAKELYLAFVDLDDAIQAAAGRAVDAIITEQGEADFRKREYRALLALPAGDEAVVALGGGTLLDANCRAHAMRTGLIVCLSANPECLERRVSTDGIKRPLLSGEDGLDLRGFLARRATHYASFPQQLDTSGLCLEEAAHRAKIAFGTFRVLGMGTGYDVRVSPGAIDSVGESLASRGLGGPVGQVSDRTVGRLYGRRATTALGAAGYPVREVRFPPGESSKRLATVNQLWRTLLEGGLERGSTIVALGGGVVGDLTGFAAATFLRGLPWVNLPTSLLAMADASLGGKTGINLPQGKNLVGAFHPPRLVLADPDLLDTLPEAEWRNGMAEVVKHGLIGDADLLALSTLGLEAIRRERREIVCRAMGVKVRLVQADPWEKDGRAALNFGHTVGHALEQATGFRLRHGEAVAVGMVAEARLAVRIGLAQAELVEELSTTLASLGLPTAIPRGVDPSAIIAAAAFDKKRSGSSVRFALPRRVGDMVVGVQVDGWEKLLAEG